MFYFDVTSVKFPFIVLLVMLTLLPIVIILGSVALLITFVFMIPAGFIGGVFYTLTQCIKLLCFVIILLPFGGIMGAIALPFIYSYSVSVPYFVHHLRRYKITL